MDDILTFVRLSRALLLSGRSGDPQAQQEERDLKDWHRLYALLVTETLTHQSHLLSSPVALETEVETLRSSNFRKKLVLESVSKRRREWLARLRSLSASHSAALDRSVKDPHPPVPLHHSVSSIATTHNQSATDSLSRDDINLSHMRDWDATDTVPHEVWLTATRLEDEGDLSGYGDSKSSRDEGDDDDDVMISTPGSDSSFGRMLRAPTSNGIDAMDVQEVDDQEPFVSPMTSQLQGLGNDFEFEF